jgi:hypothetical protein
MLTLAAIGLAASGPAWSFHCGTKLVHEGDTRAEVRAKCGEPADVEVRSILRRPVIWLRGRPFFAGTDFVEIPVETWLYNLGPNKLMRRLRFEDGVLVEIETLGHGYIE